MNSSNWTETDFITLFNDSKYLQDAFEDYELHEISYMDVIQEIELSNKVSFDLLYKFYFEKCKEYSESDLLMLFNSMHYLNCGKIITLYLIIYKSENYELLLEDIKTEIKIYLNKIKIVACNIYKHYVLLNDGTIISYLNNNDIDPDIEQFYYYLNSPSEKFTEIACGENHSIGIKEDGTVVTWGNNNGGQYNNSPSGKIVQIACGAYHSVGIREDGTLVTWGDNDWGQYNNSPEGKFIKIACGCYHSVGIREDGTVVTWGNNETDSIIFCLP